MKVIHIWHESRVKISNFYFPRFGRLTNLVIQSSPNIRVGDSTAQTDWGLESVQKTKTSVHYNATITDASKLKVNNDAMNNQKRPNVFSFEMMKSRNQTKR